MVLGEKPMEKTATLGLAPDAARIATAMAAGVAR